ncbi:MAG TPA: DUF4282 domain-containing protein [Phycisphaerales bacterium]|nr:DUF4282 domain-containing protein [Phycisphaerales bacterium]
MEEKKAFCKCLFDLSFTEFLTLKIIKVLYMVGIGIATLTGLAILIDAFDNKLAGGLLQAVCAIVATGLIIVIVRIVLELVITLFRIEENTRKEEPAAAQDAPAVEPEDNEPPATIADL